MKKTTKNFLFIFFIILCIVGLFFLLKDKINSPSALTVVGPNFLSIDRIDNVGVGSEFLIYASVGSAEQLKIEWTASDINEELDGYMVNRGISADIRMDKWQHTFPIQLTSNAFRQLSVQDTYPYIGNEASCKIEDCTDSSIPQKGTYVLAYAYEASAIPGFYKCKCIYYTDIAKVGQFLTGSQELDYNLKFQIGSEVKNMNNDNPVVSLVGGKFRAEYVGNLGTEFELNNPGYSVLYQGGQYTNLIPTDGYDYSGLYGSIADPESYIGGCVGNTILTSCLANCPAINTLINNCINKYLTDVSIGSANKNDEYKQNAHVKSISLSGNNLIADSDVPTFSPSFKMFINANWVGLQELIGKPSITDCADKVSIKGGLSKTTSITVKNIGTQAGQFDYSVTCSDDQVSFSGANGLVEAGATETFNVLFTGSNNEIDLLTGTCTHTVTDRKSQDSVSCISSFEVEYNGDFCQPGSKRCNPLNIKEIQKCNDLGIDWVLDRTCEKTCAFNSEVNDVVCSENPEPEPTVPYCKSCEEFALSKMLGSIWAEKQCKAKLIALPPQTITLCWFAFLRLILIPIVLLFATLYGIDFFERFKSLSGPKKKILRFIISLVVAGLLAYLVYISFWIGIILFVVYLLLKAFVGGYIPKFGR